MKYFLIDLSNRLHLWRCDACGTRLRGWESILPSKLEVPLCDSCASGLSEERS